VPYLVSIPYRLNEIGYESGKIQYPDDSFNSL